jgi:hypothetical protein
VCDQENRTVQSSQWWPRLQIISSLDGGKISEQVTQVTRSVFVLSKVFFVDRMVCSFRVEKTFTAGLD